jgi:hypothetical protein
MPTTRRGRSKAGLNRPPQYAKERTESRSFAVLNGRATQSPDRKAIEALSASFEHWLLEAFAPVSKTELTPEKREKRRAGAENNPLGFAKIYFPQIFSLPWNALHRWMASLGPGCWTCSGHPESGKSALAHILFAVRPLVYGLGGIVNLNTQKEPVSQDRVLGILELIRKNERIQYDFKISVERDSMTHAIVNGTHLIPGSVNTGLRNITTAEFGRVDWQVNDDLYNRITLSEKNTSDNVTDFVTGEAWRQLSSFRPSFSITLGNVITEDAPIERLRKMNPANHFSFTALNEKGESNWPEFRTKKAWEKFASTKPAHVWFGEYLEKPLVKGDVFELGWLRTFVKKAEDEFTVRIATHDAARGASPAACRKALVTGSFMADGRLIIEDIYARRESYPEFFNYALALHTRLPYLIMQFENDFAQYDLAKPYYEQWSRQTQSVLPIDVFLAKDLVTEFSSAKKEERIMYLVNPIQTDIIRFVPGVIETPDGQVFKNQYSGWPKWKENDVLDAMATLYILGKRYIETGSFKPARERSWIKSLFRGW